MQPLTLRRCLLYATVTVILFAGMLEILVRFVCGSANVWLSYRWLVHTHLVDIPYSEFRQRQKQIQAVRAKLRMERGRDHPVFGWIYNPNFRIDEAGLEIHINSHGMRGEEFPKIKPSGEIRIMCLGGSTTAGEEVGESQTYPAQLQTILRSDIPGNNIRVINAGVPSYDVPRSWTYYGLRLYEFAPDFVLIYHGFNDLLANAAGDVEVLPSLNYSGMPLSPFVFEGDARRGGFLGSLFTPIRSIIAHSDLLTLLYYGWQAGTSRWRSSVSPPSQRGIEAYLACYRALVRDIQATGATPVIATFAISYPGNFSASDEKKIAASLRMGSLPPEVGKQIIDMQNQSVIRMSRELGLPLCDLAAVVPQDRSHFVDSCHLTAEGNHTIAAALARTIEPLVKSFIDTRLVPKRSSAGAGRSVDR